MSGAGPSAVVAETVDQEIAGRIEALNHADHLFFDLPEDAAKSAPSLFAWVRNKSIEHMSNALNLQMLGPSSAVGSDTPDPKKSRDIAVGYKRLELAIQTIADIFRDSGISTKHVKDLDKVSERLRAAMELTFDDKEFMQSIPTEAKDRSDFQEALKQIRSGIQNGRERG